MGLSMSLCPKCSEQVTNTNFPGHKGIGNICLHMFLGKDMELYHRSIFLAHNSWPRVAVGSCRCVLEIKQCATRVAAIKFGLAFKPWPALHFFKKFAFYRHFRMSLHKRRRQGDWAQVP